MTKEQVTMIVMVMGTNMVNLEKNLTPIVSKLRRGIRRQLNRLAEQDKATITKCTRDTADAWRDACNEIMKDGIILSVSTMLMSLNSIISNEKYTNKFYTQKTLDGAIASILTLSNATNTERYADAEKGANIMVKTLCRHMGIERPQRLQFLSKRLNMIKEK